ncbi:hypothetical protein DAPPUDRAFT_255376 [Daphnia pulex]|uniref:Uncharacterized protein n=1 Tax=Daphnia pulex TaxID=6669 RepID=E9H925_DAPPU|nr:hypothetical protein DAPPUDRAFT_255376 [Daphnia pulex]|eukprot:EFX71715.1 hypothetical protein DAPPUDRAFT_255376 [Daphnia pulex]
MDLPEETVLDGENKDGELNGDDAEPQRKKKSLQVLKDSKRQRKQEKAVNHDGEADFCAQFYYYCKTDSEDEKD